jgi:hypothetical protein
MALGEYCGPGPPLDGSRTDLVSTRKPPDAYQCRAELTPAASTIVALFNPLECFDVDRWSGLDPRL